MEKILVEVKRLDNAGNIRASVTASIPTEWGPLAIHQIKLIQKPGEEPWVAFPQGSYSKEGQTRYVNLLEVPWQVRKQIREEILDALAR